ncbi:MAG: recombinase family protein [Pseudomonadota bacterium]
MNNEKETPQQAVKAVIYCRVSSKKQTKDGTGLDSQEHRCRQHAKERGYIVKAVFPDDVSGGGDFMNRPGMVSLLQFLDERPFDNYVVIFDDLKRYARDTEFHLALKRAMEARNATRECLNFRFDDSPEGEFVETIFAAQAQLERKQNRRQVLQKMKARVEQGFWVKKAPVGYHYIASPRGGKELEPNEPQASIVREALEGYATGRFASQTEVQRFLEADPHYPKDLPNGKLRSQTVPRLLRKPVYAGYIGSKALGVSLRKARLEGLISFETHQKILDKLERGVYAAARKDIHADFPLRGAVSCACCEKPMTAGWSAGKYQKYAYYRCRTKGCEMFGKGIQRDKIEKEFAELLQRAQPAQELATLAAAMFRDCWDQLANQATALASSRQEQVDAVEREISELVKRAVSATNARVIAAYEKSIDDLEKRKLILMEKAENPGRSSHNFDELFEHAMEFLKNPCKLWVSGRLELQRIVLKLVFFEHLTYCRERGFLNTKMSIPFNVLGADSPLVLQNGAAGVD